MPAEVLYRKWRPQRFADVSGQEVVKRTLTNALAQGKVSHAYLFSGPRGTGKTTMGRLLTKAINCERIQDAAGEPCNECASCIAFNAGTALDLVELDGASNRGIDEIRKLRENVGYMPMAGSGAHKVYLIDEVHMLTDQAFNALLKTLEEPPPHIVFILATTDAHKVPPTIVSRCQRLDFRRIPLGAIVDRLAHIAANEGIAIPREGLELVARSATGSLRDAINLLEQICDSWGKEATLEAVREGLGLIADERAAGLALQAVHADLAGALSTIGAVRDDGIDLKQFQKEVVARLRELLLVQAGAEGDATYTPEQVDAMRESIAGVPGERIVRVLKLFSQADLRQDQLSPLPLELAIAESMVAPAATQPAASTTTQRPAPPMQRPASPAPAARPAPSSRAPARPAPQPRAPEHLRRDNITGASAEDIARMVGSKGPVIPPATDEPEGDAPAAAPATGNGGQDQPAAAPAAEGAHIGDDGVDLDAFVSQHLRPAARKRSMKLDALLNGTCRAVSWQDGVLTLGFYQDAYPKKTAEEPANRKAYEEIASALLGKPVSIRCIIAPRQAKALSKSPLVQHAVQNLGATIVSDDED